MKYKSLGCLMLLLGLVLLVLLGGSVYMLNYSLVPANNYGRDYNLKYRQLFADYPEIRPWVDSLRKAHALRDTFITNADGERHHAFLIAAPHPTGRTAVLVHGYTDCAVSMLHLGYFYHHDLGYNLLLPDLHAHGKSEGRAAQMGWKDRWDVLRWIAIADSLYRDSTAHAEIVVHGISMGAATTMAVAGEKTPASVKAFIEDCGYTSVWDEFADQLHEQFGLPAFPLMYTTSMLCRLKYGWSFGEASMVEAVRRCQKPMLFIHGGHDTFVPTRMVFTLFQAKPGRKSLYLAHGSIHAKSHHDHKAEYQERVVRFLNGL
ncbi:MAG: alpha/beta hydrolase [Prevotella sp.]|nr:alpha/beta hydrolase [Prevotella sp.]